MSDYLIGIRRAGILSIVLGMSLASIGPAQEQAPPELLSNSRRIVFLGDSLTASGLYVANVEAWLVARKAKTTPFVIDAGLPSETVSGLSEEGHAGGKFPRPDLAERLDRVLALTKPDLVIACYGINCAIYQPFDESRFEKYQRGMQNLKSKVEQSGAKLVVMTPPCYDDQRAPKSFSYNEVLDRYSDWLIERRKDGWLVVDLHGPMTRELQKRRAADPQFTFQPDGVHPNEEGYWVIAQQLIRWFGDEASASAATPQMMLADKGVNETALSLVRERVNVLRDAYVAAAGHKRPGVAQGLPVPEAEQRAAVLSSQIAEIQAGFISMFNGRDFTGWRFTGDPPPQEAANWKVADGVIRLSGGGQPHLATDREYSDFEMRFEWRGTQDKYNSGFFIRSGKNLGTNQLNLAKESEGAFIGGKLEGAKPVGDLQKPAGQWNEWRVVVQGETVEFWCNGQQAWKGTGLKPPKGFIGLQAEGAPLEFRNLRIREIP